MHSPTLTLILSSRNAIMLALGLTASTLAGAGGCAPEVHEEVCADTEIDFATCGIPSAPDPNGPSVRYEYVCFDASDGCDPCDAEAITGAALEQARGTCTINELQHVTLACGPDPESEDCCYKVRLQGDLYCAFDGRPLRVGAERAPRVAALQSGAAWLANMRGFAGLRRPQDPELLERLRSHWLACARFEHASVAAFARVGQQLLSLGAPADLLRATHAAMADEVRHAQLCFGLAAAYDTPELGSGPLRIEGCVATGMDLETTLREAIFEGALNEGAAALEALEGARACEDPVVREVLVRIAEDEQRHALLAYQTVKWALLAYPERARELVRGCLRDGHLHAPMPASASVDDDAAARSHGLISSDARAWLRYQTWTDVVAPILAAMLSASRGAAVAVA
jgi:hypothetical protein